MVIRDSFADLGVNLKVGENADQVEALAIEYGRASVNNSLLDERISGEMDDESQGDRIEGDTAISEERAGETLEHLQLRVQLLENAYPFTLEGQVLHHRCRPPGIYEFCLELSRARHDAGHTKRELVLFERLSAKLVAHLIGGYSWRTGWPSHDKDERPVRLAQLARKLTEATGEWWWQPMPGNSPDPDPRTVKDEGLDFLVWRTLDTRAGSLFIAGQCACGDDWRNKLNDLSWDRLSRWWARPCHVSFVRALAIPYVVPGHMAIGDLSRNAGLVFDRIRLTLASCPSDRTQSPAAWLAEQRRDAGI